MKMKDIELGKDYAQFPSKYSRSPHCVRVLEKGLSYGDAKGRGVRVKFYTNSEERIVSGSEIRYTWDDWLIEKQRIAELQDRADSSRARIDRLSDRLVAAFEEVGIDATVYSRSFDISIRLDEQAAAQLISTLE